MNQECFSYNGTNLVENSKLLIPDAKNFFQTYFIFLSIRQSISWRPGMFLSSVSMCLSYYVVPGKISLLVLLNIVDLLGAPGYFWRMTLLMMTATRVTSHRPSRGVLPPPLPSPSCRGQKSRCCSDLDIFACPCPSVAGSLLSEVLRKSLWRWP